MSLQTPERITPERTQLGQAADHAGAVAVHAAEPDSFYNASSVRGGSRPPRFQRGLYSGYDRDIASYTGELNETTPDGEPVFDLNDWKGKTIVDIGSGGYDRFGMEARHKGVHVISLNPALRELKTRELLVEGERIGNKQAESEAWNQHAAQGLLKRIFTKPAKVPELKSESVAALGQALPLRDGSVDGVVSVFGVPHYLYHQAPKDATEAERAAITAQDKALMSTMFHEVERVLKPGGKAFFKDIHDPRDEDIAVEALAELTGSDYRVYVNEDPKAESNQRGGIARTIELTKGKPQNPK